MSQCRSARGGFGLALSLASLLAVPTPASAGRGAALGWSSGNVLRGLDLADGHGAWTGGLYYLADAGWYAGTSASQIELFGEKGAQWLLYGGVNRRLDDDWRLGALYTHYDQWDGPPGGSLVYDEWLGSLSWRERLSASFAFSPNVRYGPHELAGYTADLVLHQPLRGAWSLDAGIGRFENQGKGYDAFYSYGSVGLRYSLGAWSITGVYMTTNDTAQERFGDLAVRRWVFGVLRHFD